METCDGKSFFWIDPDKKKKTCANQGQGTGVILNPIQVEAFQSLFRAKVRGGMSNLEAFVEAIVQTSDVVFAVMKKKNADLIAIYDEKRERNYEKYKLRKEQN